MTFSRPEVAAASRGFVMLKADLTAGGDEKVKAFSRKYGIRRPDPPPRRDGDRRAAGTGFEPAEAFLADEESPGAEPEKAAGR